MASGVRHVPAKDLEHIWPLGFDINIEFGGRGARVDTWKSPVLPLEVNAMYFALATFIPSTV